MGGSVANSITRTIDPRNDAPVATFNTPQFITEDGGTLEGQLTATDVELSRGDNAGKSLSYYQTSSVDGLLIDTDGSFTFNSSDNAYNYLALNESLTLTVNYEVTDDLLGLNPDATTYPTTQGSFTITVTGFNDDPYAVGNTLAALTPGTEDTTSTFTIADLTQGYADYDTSDNAILTVQLLQLIKLSTV